MESVLAAPGGTEVFSNEFGMGASGEFGDTDAVGHEALVSGDPSIELTEGLLDVMVRVAVEDVYVLTED